MRELWPQLAGMISAGALGIALFALGMEIHTRRTIKKIAKRYRDE